MKGQVSIDVVGNWSILGYCATLPEHLTKGCYLKVYTFNLAVSEKDVQKDVDTAVRLFGFQTIEVIEFSTSRVVAIKNKE